MITLSGRIINITQNNYGVVSFDFLGPDGAPFSLRGYTVVFMVKHSKEAADSTAIIAKTYAGLVTTSVDVEILPKDVSSPVDFYYWSITLSKDNYRNEALSGPFYIIEGVQD